MKRLFVIDLKDYDENWERSTRPSVRGIIKYGNKFAVVHNQKYDYYAFPGGGIEDGEEFYQALIREVKEETGLTVIPETIEEFGSALRISSSRIYEKTIFEQENFYYICQVESSVEKPKLEDYELEEGLSLAIVSPEEMIRKNKYDDHKEQNNSVWIERETRILEMYMEGINNYNLD